MDKNVTDQIRLLKHAGHSYGKIDRLLGLAPGTSCNAIHETLKADDSRVCEYCGKTVRRIMRHTTNYLTGEVKRACPKCHYEQHNGKPTKERPTGSNKLTARERELLGYILEGKRNWESARLMTISLRTVEKHRMAIYRKLGVTSGVELAMAVRA